MRRFLTILLTLVLTLPSVAQLRSPEVMSTDVAGSIPYRWSGLTVITDSAGSTVRGTGSGVILQPRVYATAAHVIFDDANGSWRAPATVRFAPGHHSSRVTPRTGRPATAFYYWSSYRTRQADHDGPAGTSSPDAFNLDFAVGYRLQPWLADGSHARSFVGDPGEIPLMREQRQMMIVGYPADPSGIDRFDIGRMHGTPAGEYEVYWDARDSDEATQMDSGNIGIATYQAKDVIVYGGNSGGPFFVEGDDGEWLVNGLVVSGSTRDTAGVRALDANAWELVAQAAEASTGSSRLSRVKRPGAEAKGQEVRLSWEPSGPSADEYIIERRGDGRFVEIAKVPADVTTYVDREIVPGTGYTYRVTAWDAGGLWAPASPEVKVDTKGSDLSLGAALGARGLWFTTGGDASVRVQDGQLETGSTESMERSYVELSILGPGVLTFDWAVSSEENPDYDNRDSRNEGEIYDAFYFYHNDTEMDFLTGEEGPFTHTVDVPSGKHTFRWEYRKDPYSNEGLDAGFLSNLSWKSQNQRLYFYGAADAGPEYRRTGWFGYYSHAHLPWTYSPEHGWLYLSKAPDRSLWAYDPDPEVGWIYLSPEAFPHVYLPQYGWAYYYRHTGNGGQGRFFYLFDEKRHLETGTQ